MRGRWGVALPSAFDGEHSKPEKKVNIMTGLRKQRTNTFWRAPPSVAMDVAVREVLLADGLGVFDRDYFTNDSLMEQQLPKKSIVGAVARTRVVSRT